MLDHPLPDTESWVLLLSNNSLPVLRHTQRQIEEMRKDIDRVDARDLAHIILQDPIMAVRVLAYIQPLHGRSLRNDITTIAGAILMSGLHPFFTRFHELISIESMLKGEDPHALLGVLQIIRRAQRAAEYAYDWARRRHDINVEEVRLAALLHDLAEILVWSFAPKLGLQIRALQVANPTMRSVVAQTQVLGFTFQELQMELCRVWHLPALLQNLIDDDNTNQLRVKNVILAVRLARHSAHGWDDPALPDDYADIGELLHMTPEAVKHMLGVPQAEQESGALAESEGAPPPQPQ